MQLSLLACGLFLLSLSTQVFGFAPPEVAKLPPVAPHTVDFEKEIKPLFEAACVKCHAKGREKGEFSIETREAFLKGGETGPAAIVGKSGESLVVEAVAGIDRDLIMPKKGTRWTAEQVGLLRAWIDQGAAWPAGISFAKPPPENLHPRPVVLPERPLVHPVDHLLGAYFAEKALPFPPAVDDARFARRVYLDLIGLLPTPEQLDTFLADRAPDKRAKLVRALLEDRRAYAEHWLTFWNDLLRNDYKGAGFIDGGRKQISGWLYQSLVENKRYDQFVAQLVAPTSASEGFSRGIIWRGTVPAAMLPPMQAAQNVSQVFLGVNLKCTSCHDSFINDWTLADAYGLAAVYAEEPLELVHCDKPTGKTAAMRFLYPELGALDPTAAKPERLARLASLLTSRENGRLARTIVNRFWARLLGRGLIEPVDDMEQSAWSRDLLDWLAEDLVAHGYDLKRTLEVICTSRAYAAPAVPPPREKEEFVFHGPLTRRLTAEQVSDALSAMSGDWARLPTSIEFDFEAAGSAPGVTMPRWLWTDEPVELGLQREALRSAKGQLDEATKQLGEAQKAVEAALAKGASAEPGRVAAEQAAVAASAAQEQLRIAAAPRPARGPGSVIPESERHRVIFRKTITIREEPAEAYAVILASQSFAVRVNGALARATLRDGFRSGRIALLNLKPLLVPGENAITLDVSSHTEKQMNDEEKKKFPASLTHLNAQSGVAFYLRCVPRGGKEILEVRTDETWRVRRSPDGAWRTAEFSDGHWLPAAVLPEGALPVDEGPSLEPVTRKDFANLPVELGPQLKPAVSTAAQPGQLRAAFLAADPLQVALDRPNREVVVPVRASAATTIQALELTNGMTLDKKLQKAADILISKVRADTDGWLTRTFRHALGRAPSAAERSVALELLAAPAKREGVTDLLWTIVNHPEFQLIN